LHAGSIFIHLIDENAIVVELDDIGMIIKFNEQLNLLFDDFI